MPRFCLTAVTWKAIETLANEKPKSLPPEPEDSAKTKKPVPISAIGDQLRRVYGEVLVEPVPAELESLIQRIVEKKRSGESDG